MGHQIATLVEPSGKLCVPFRKGQFSEECNKIEPNLKSKFSQEPQRLSVVPNGAYFHLKVNII